MSGTAILEGKRLVGDNLSTMRGAIHPMLWSARHGPENIVKVVVGDGSPTRTNEELGRLGVSYGLVHCSEHGYKKVERQIEVL